MNSSVSSAIDKQTFGEAESACILQIALSTLKPEIRPENAHIRVRTCRVVYHEVRGEQKIEYKQRDKLYGELSYILSYKNGRKKTAATI